MRNPTEPEILPKAVVPSGRRFRLGRWLTGWAWYLGIRAALAAFVLVVLFALFNPPTTLTIIQNARDYPIQNREWARLDEIAPVMARSVVAAEDANFCLHWGFDMKAIRLAIAEGGNRGASTLSQQTVKNVFLWHGRSWLRKAAEGVLTPVVELVWTKRRILHVYMNVAEFGEGVFGVEAAAQHWFGVSAADLTPTQAARLAAVLPDPKTRNPANPGPLVRRRTASILSGAETIAADGRASCFID